MTNREAIERAMAALNEQGRIAPNAGKTKARPVTASNASDELKAEAAADAEAWNMLRHLSRIL